MVKDSNPFISRFPNKGRVVPVLTLSVFLLMSITILSSDQQHVQAQETIECISIRSNETSVAGPSPSPNVISNLPAEVGRGFSNISDITKLTGDNFAILLNNKDISNPSLTIAEGLERAQLGGDIPGQQGTILEGEILRNVTSLCWQK
ncbi:MAG: hypothetical protein ACRD8W_01755 [Nitrososphaeraceae archaeon]